MTHTVLVLGAGFVARPLVAYLLNQPDLTLIVASLYLEDAQRLINHHPNGIAKQLNVEDRASLAAEVERADVIISLLPWTYHIDVAKLCLEKGKHLVTASYVKPEMQALDAQARKRGLLFLNEMGVDPGIDHMAAMSVIHRVHEEGGKILSFYSYCGGLPAPAYNTNPLGYKFSWSPVGVMLAATSDGQYLKDGEVVQVSAHALFTHYWLVDIPDAGTFEAYVNRDALPYIERYHIPEVRSMYRGTLRNIGHCESWHLFKKLGLLNRERMFDFGKNTVRDVLAELADSDGTDPAGDVAAFLKIPPHSVTIKKLQWLGLFDDIRLPLKNATAFDMFAHILQTRLVYQPGETDMLVQHHEFIVDLPETGRQRLTSTMVDIGIPDGDSSMARTVSLPVAIATRLILEQKIRLAGVHIPVLPEIYQPVLNELATMGIRLTERTLPVE